MTAYDSFDVVIADDILKFIQCIHLYSLESNFEFWSTNLQIAPIRRETKQVYGFLLICLIKFYISSLCF